VVQQQRTGAMRSIVTKRTFEQHYDNSEIDSLDPNPKPRDIRLLNLPFELEGYLLDCRYLRNFRANNLIPGMSIPMSIFEMKMKNQLKNRHSIENIHLNV